MSSSDDFEIGSSQKEIDGLFSHALVLNQLAETTSAPGAELKYTVTFRELNGPGDDIAKQLIVMLGTLVTAVASFYFGSASVASASAAVLGRRPAGPVTTTVTPNPVTATGDGQALTIVGSDLAGITKLHLERAGEADISAEGIKATDTLLTAQITIPKGKTGRWNIVVNDGPHATTIGTIDVIAPAAPTAEVAAGLNGKASTMAVADLILASAAVPATTSAGFLGHGMFLEYAPMRTLQRYAGYKEANPVGATTEQLVGRFIQAMQDMHVASVWIQLFTASGVLDGDGRGGTKELVDGLRRAKIGVAGWGYCYSENAATDAGLAKHLCGQYGITAFVADVEPGNPVHDHPDTWQPAAFNNLIAGLKGTFGKDNLGISTFGSLKGHDDAAKIYRLAINDVAMFAPQVYWYKSRRSPTCSNAWPRSARPVSATPWWERPKPIGRSTRMSPRRVI